MRVCTSVLKHPDTLGHERDSFQMKERLPTDRLDCDLCIPLKEEIMRRKKESVGVLLTPGLWVVDLH